MTSSRTHRLSNGLTLAVLERPATHQAQVRLMVRVGSRFESEQECGISHFLEHVLFRGSEGFAGADQVYRAFEGVGGMLDAHTGVESTEFEFTAHPERLAEGVGHLARFIRAPTFAGVEKERAILLDELAYDHNEQGHLINPAILAAEQMWPGHPLGRSVGGVPEIISRFSEDQLRQHHARHYRPGSMVLGVAGPVEAIAVIEAVTRHFGDWQPGGAPPPPPPEAPPVRADGPRVKIVPDSGNQIHLQLSFPAPHYNDPRELETMLLTRTLDDGPTSRLQRVIREERALVYHIAAAYTAYWDTGSIEIATSIRTEHLMPLVNHLLAELAGFREQGPTADEVERARLRHLFDLEFEQDYLSAQLDRYAWPLLFGKVREPGEERERMAALTQETLRQLAAGVLASERLHLVLTGPLDAASEREVRDAVRRY